MQDSVVVNTGYWAIVIVGVFFLPCPSHKLSPREILQQLEALVRQYVEVEVEVVIKKAGKLKLELKLLTSKLYKVKVEVKDDDLNSRQSWKVAT